MKRKEKRALEGAEWITPSVLTGTIDAILSGVHRAQEPSRGGALTSGVLSGAGTGLSHGLSSAAAIGLLDHFLPGDVKNTLGGTILKGVTGLGAGVAGGRILPAIASAGLDKLRPSRSQSEGYERTASLKEGSMNVQELAQRALGNIKKEKMAGPMDIARILASLGGAAGGAYNAEPGVMNSALQGAKSGLGTAAGGALGGFVGGQVGNLAGKMVPIAGIQNLLQQLGQLAGAGYGSYKGYQAAAPAEGMEHKISSFNKYQLAKIAMEGDDPLNSQSAHQESPGMLTSIHRAVAGKTPWLLGASPLQAGAEILHQLGYAPEGAANLAAGYSRFADPDEGWASGLGQGAISAGGAHLGRLAGRAAGKAINVGQLGVQAAQRGINPDDLSLDEIRMVNAIPASSTLGSILGSNLKMGSKKKKANFSNPMGEQLPKQPFMHSMDEPADMSAASQAGSMGSAKPKKDPKAGPSKEKKADELEGTAMRSFMNSWNKSDLHGKIDHYKNFMSRVGKYSTIS